MEIKGINVHASQQAKQNKTSLYEYFSTVLIKITCSLAYLQPEMCAVYTSMLDTIHHR